MRRKNTMGARAALGEKGGAGLIVALAMLFLFSAMGGAWLLHMYLEEKEANLRVNTLQARAYAEGGIRVAMARIEAQLRAGKAPDLSPFEVEFPLYRFDAGAAVTGFSASEDSHGAAAISVSDECAKLNLNHAPTRVLQRFLSVGGSEARDIRASLPRTDGAPETDPSRKWLTSIDDLRARGLVSAEVFAKLDRDLLTVHSVADQSHPEGFINVNSAPAAIMAAVLDVDDATAEKVVAARPFSSLSELAAAAGKEPAAFSIPPSPERPNELPRELTFSSRTYRIVSVGDVVGVTGEGMRRVEAVAHFPQDGPPRIIYWSEAPETDEPATAS